jgi:antirestriction protein
MVDNSPWAKLWEKNKMSELKIDVCLGCHASYNDGYLLDKWYKCNDIDDIDKACDEFQKYVLETMREMARKEGRDQKYIDTFYPDLYAEEIYLADCEVYLNGEFIKLDVKESIFDLKNWVENMSDALLELDSDRVELYNELLKEYGHTDALEKAKEAWEIEIETNKNQDVGYYFAHEANCFFTDANKTLEYYFDYESYGRDILLDSNYTELKNKIYMHD